MVVAEVKIWGRNDYQEVPRQVEGYWSERVTTGAVVMFTDREIPGWAEVYRQKCLGPHGVADLTRTDPRSPLLARLDCRSTAPDGMAAEVSHLLLRLPRRP